MCVRFVVLAVLLAAPVWADDAPAKPVRLDDGWPPPSPVKEQNNDEPAIWRVLRRVHDELPKYRNEAVTFSPAPVIVDGITGIGIAGNF